MVLSDGSEFQFGCVAIHVELVVPVVAVATGMLRLGLPAHLLAGHAIETHTSAAHDLCCTS